MLEACLRRLKFSLKKAFISHLLTFCYTISSACLKKEKVVFACNFSNDIYGNLLETYNQLKKSHPDVLIVYRPRTILEYLKEITLFGCAKLIVVDCSHWLVSNVNISKNTKIVYIGHGGGCFKKMGYATKNTANRKDCKKVNKLYGQYSYVLSTTAKFDQQIAENFNVSLNSIICCGLPRTDRLFSKKYSRQQSIILFAPSFYLEKDGRRTYNWEFEQLAKIAALAGFTVWFSTHPDTPKSDIPKDWVDCSDFSYQKKLQVPSLLITDQSSLMFDFCVTGKPILLSNLSSAVDTWIPANELHGVNLCRSYQELYEKLINVDTLQSSFSLYDQQMNRCKGNSSNDLCHILSEIYNK